MEPFFRGGKVTLRRALPRSEASELCERLIAGGLDCHLVQRGTPEPAPEAQPGLAAAETAPPPNLFQIRSDLPSRDTSADVSQLRFLATALATGLAGIALLAAVLARTFWWTPTHPVSGPESIVAAADGTLFMLAGNRLLVHNRAGSDIATISAGELGLESIGRLLHASDGGLVLSGTASDAAPSALRPWRCALGDAAIDVSCTPLTSGPLALESAAASRLGDALFAVTAAHELVRVGAGEVRARMPLPQGKATPRLVNHRGLLLVNTSEGPGLGIYRPDAGAFGEQVDEVLLMHPGAIAREQDLVRDFAVTADLRWALMAGNGTVGLYAFDATWAPAEAASLPMASAPEHLATWRDRLLLYTPAALKVERVSPAGRVEAPLLSDSLKALAESTQTRALQERVLFSLCLLALGIAVALGSVLTWVAWHARADVANRSAAPGFLLEHHLQRLHWIPADPDRDAARRRWILAATATGAAGLAAVLAGLPALSALCLPLLFLALAAIHYLRTPLPRVGLRGSDLALVDHRGVYQTGAAQSFHTRGPFILRGGVIVCTGLPGLPGLRGASLSGPGTSPAHADAAEDDADPHPARVLGLLLQTRHPLVALILAIPAGAVAAACIAIATA